MGRGENQGFLGGELHPHKGSRISVHILSVGSSSQVPGPGGAAISKIRWRPWRQITGTGPAPALRACAGKSRKADGSRVVRWGKSLEWFSSVQFRSRAKANRILPREHTGHSRHSKNTREASTRGHHQMVRTGTRLIIFAAKDAEALYSQQKQDQELTVALIMRSLLPTSDVNGGPGILG